MTSCTHTTQRAEDELVYRSVYTLCLREKRRTYEQFYSQISHRVTE